MIFNKEYLTSIKSSNSGMFKIENIMIMEIQNFSNLDPHTPKIFHSSDKWNSSADNVLKKNKNLWDRLAKL